MASLQLRTALHEIGIAVRRPEQLATRWRDRRLRPELAPTPWIFPLLLASAVLGLAAYGLTLGLHRGAGAMAIGAIEAPLSAGAAWSMALPALYILGSSLGSRLDPSTTALAALITCSFGATAMLAGVPVTTFFTLALPWTWARVLVHLTVFAGVGVAMTDVFLRTMRALEPERSLLFPMTWLALMGTLGAELMLLLGLFDL